MISELTKDQKRIVKNMIGITRYMGIDAIEQMDKFDKMPLVDLISKLERYEEARVKSVTAGFDIL